MPFSNYLLSQKHLYQGIKGFSEALFVHLIGFTEDLFFTPVLWQDSARSLVDAIEGDSSIEESQRDAGVLEDEDSGTADELQQWDKRLQTGSDKQATRKRSKHNKQ